MGTNARKRRLFLRQVVGLIVFVVLCGLGWQLLAEQIQSRGTVSAKFISADGARTTPRYSLKVAATDGDRARGLMFVPPSELSDNRGMLFVFPDAAQRSFWMKDTVSPLDIIFIDERREVLGVVENAVPYTTTQRSVDGASKYVVELLAGTAARDGIRKGMKLEIVGELPVAP